MTDLQRIDITEIKGKVSTAKSLSVSLLTLGCVTFGLGIPTLTFGALAPQIHTPYVAASGISCGIATVAAGAVIMVYIRRLEESTISKGYVTAFTAVSQICLQTTNLHLTFSLWGLINCAFEVEPFPRCGANNRPALLLLTAVNVALALPVFAIIISLMCIFCKTGRIIAQQTQKVEPA